MRSLHLRVAVTAALSCVCVLAHAADSSATFRVDHATEVPGGVLKPGQYTVHIVDSLADRMIVRIDGNDSKTSLLMLGVHGNQAGSGAVTQEWQNHVTGKHAIRGFAIPGSNNVELVYPKNEAVAIANANDASVVAIDPASEGRPELSKLSSADMQIVNLWLLTPVRVAPGTASAQKGIEAKHYEGTASTTQLAANSPAPAPQPSSVSRKSAPPADSTMVASAQPPASSHATTHRSAAVGRTLPKTASNLPLMWLTGIVCLVGASGMRMRQWRSVRSS